jgi:hypothetical protein
LLDIDDDDGVVYGVHRARMPPRTLPDFGADEIAAVTAGRVGYPI